MTKDYKLNGTNCSCGKSFMTEYQVNGHYASHFKKAKSTKDSWLDDILYEYRKVCFLVKDNLYREDAVNLMAMANIATKNKLLSHIEQQQIELLKKICQDNWQKPIPEQYILDLIKERLK